MLRYLFIFLLLIPALFPSTAYAQVVINEVLPNPEGDESGEFIELYNNSDAEVVLDGYKLADPKKIFEIVALTLGAHEYKVFFNSETKIQINNKDQETITLEDDQGVEIDTFGFSDSIEGRSWSRIPNATGSPTNNTNLTPNAENSPPPTPTPEPTNSPTPEPANESEDPDPTSTPSPTHTPIPTKKVTPTKSPSRTLTPTLFKVDLENASSNGDDVDIDGLRDKLDGEVLGSESEGEGKFPIAAFLLVGSGICFVTASGYLIQKKRREENDGVKLKE